MKILRIFVAHCNAEAIGQNYYKSFSNNKIDFSKFLLKTDTEEMNVSLQIAVIKFSDALNKSIVQTIKLSAKSSHLLRDLEVEDDKHTGIEKKEGLIEALVFGTVSKYHYDQSCFDIFDFITDIFIKLLNSHIFHNGNKRTSIITLRTILWSFGYYLKLTSKNKYIYEKIYEEKLKYFVTKLQKTIENIDDKNQKKIKKEIKNWIINNIVIAWNFRKA